MTRMPHSEASCVLGVAVAGSHVHGTEGWLQGWAEVSLSGMQTLSCGRLGIGETVLAFSRGCCVDGRAEERPGAVFRRLLCERRQWGQRDRVGNSRQEAEQQDWSLHLCIAAGGEYGSSAAGWAVGSAVQAAAGPQA